MPRISPSRNVKATESAAAQDDAAADETAAAADDTTIGGAPVDEATKLAAEPKASGPAGAHGRKDADVTLATVDDWALRPLADMYVDVAFIGTNGCTVERGLTTPDPAEAAVAPGALHLGIQRRRAAAAGPRGSGDSAADQALSAR